jgi:type IV secretion system protein VirB4
MMLNLARVIKPWKEADALSAHINLYGFWTETTFLTKSGDLGMVLSVAGVDYESLDNDEQQYAVKRLESALKSFGEDFHVYQYLFKTNRPEIPFATYDDELIDAAIDQRRQFFESKRDRLYQIEIFYVIVLEGARSKTGILPALARIPRDPQGGIRELKAQFTSDNMKVLLRTQIDADLVRLEQRVQNFTRQLADLMPIEVQGQQEQFSFFRRLLNFDDWRIAGKPQSTQYLDYQVVNSNIEAERDHLRVGDHFVRILTMKESIAEARTLLDSFNTGHAGSMATIHASSAVKALRRFGELAMRSHQQSNRDDISAEIAETVQIVAQVGRFAEGRKVSEIIAVRGYDRAAKLFLYDTIYDRDGAIGRPIISTTTKRENIHAIA